MGNQRECGVLLPISSLPSKYGIGCFSKSAYEFVDQLKAAGQGCWQILPLGPTSYGDSPYQSFSTFAGNPYFISLEDLIEEGVLTEKECDAVDFGSREDDVDYEKIYKGRYKLLRKAYERSDISKNSDFVRFQQEQAHWLGDYALFMAVKDQFEGIPWTEMGGGHSPSLEQCIGLLQKRTDILKLNSRSICSSNFMNSGRN